MKRMLKYRLLNFTRILFKCFTGIFMLSVVGLLLTNQIGIFEGIGILFFGFIWWSMINTSLDMNFFGLHKEIFGLEQQR